MSERVQILMSGKGSKRLWHNINKVRNFDETTHAAIFHLACRCQELETVIRDLQRRVGQLEQQVKQ